MPAANNALAKLGQDQHSSEHFITTNHQLFWGLTSIKYPNFGNAKRCKQPNMAFFKKLFTNRTRESPSNLPLDFDQQVKLAIRLLGEKKGTLEDQEVIQLLLENGIERTHAVEIILFLPIAFVRNWLTSFKWHDTYQELMNDNKTLEKRFLDSNAYQVIWKVTNDYFSHSPNEDTVLKIGGRSAEFNAINQALNDNPNAKLEELKLSQTIIYR